MTLTVQYRQRATADGHRTFSEKVQTDDPTAVIPQLQAAAKARGVEIRWIMLMAGDE